MVIRDNSIQNNIVVAPFKDAAGQVCILKEGS